MDAKEQILNSIAEELQLLIPNHKLSVRNDHGCWEIISRNSNRIKVLECVMAEDPNDDSVYVHINEDYSKAAEPISLSDPTSLDRLFVEIRKGLGYV